jgi:hypothetical protein
MELSLGQIAGALSIGLVLVGWGVVWANTKRDVASVKEDVASVKATHAKCPITTAITDLGWIKQRQNELWSIVSGDTKSKRDDLWAHNSPLTLTPLAISNIPPKIKQTIDSTEGTYNDKLTRVRELSISEDELVALARERKWSVAELVFVINDYAKMKASGGLNGQTD